MTRARILANARRMAKDVGLVNLSMVDLCDAVHIPPGSFGNIMGQGFQEMIMDLMKDKRLPFAKSATTSALRAVHPELRKSHILKAAMVLSKRDGYDRITRSSVAVYAGVSPSLVTKCFGDMDGLRAAIMREAIATREYKIVARGLMNRDEIAEAAPKDVRELAAQSITRK